jgi:hypothetical protein
MERERANTLSPILEIELNHMWQTKFILINTKKGKKDK